MTDRFTELALTVTRRAVEIATDSGAGKAGSQHLLLALVENPQTSERFRNIGVTTENLAQVISKTFPNKGKVNEKGFDTDAEKVIQKGIFFALNMSAEKKLSTDLMTLAMLRDGSTNAFRCLEMLAVDIAQLEALLIASIQHNNGGEPELAGVGASARGVSPSSPRGKTSSKKTPHLEQFATNLTQMAVDGNLDPVIGRDKEIERLLQVLSRRTKNNPVLVGEPGVGKAQPLDALIHTPAGWKTMGDMEVGTVVSTPDGGSAPVIGVYPQGERDVYKITFANGQVVEASDEHLWNVYGMHTGVSNRARLKTWKTVTTLELKDRIESTQNVYKIPVTKPVTFSETSNLVIPPYLLGALLGDGTLDGRSVRFTSADEELIEKFRSMLGEDYELNRITNSKVDYRLKMSLSNPARNGRSLVGDMRNEFLKELKELNLSPSQSHTKYVPQKYKESTEANRLALLQGLLDTDGYVTKTGSIIYTTVSEQLAKDVQDIIHSLGGLAKIVQKQKFYTYKEERKAGRPSYNVSIRFPRPTELFSLQRKVDRLPKNYQYKDLKNRVVSVELVGRKVVQCIMVDHTDHLYLTDGYVVTHNTAIVEGLAQALLDEDTVTDSLKGRTVWTLDLAGLMAGTRYRGDFEQRLKKIIQEIQESKAIVFIDEIHALMTAGGGEGALNAANIMKPVLSRGEMQTIGATTYDEFRKHFEKDAAMARRFQKIDVNEPSIEDAIRILKGIRGEYEKHHNIVLTDAAVETAVKLSARYIQDRHLPDKAIDLIDEAGAKAKIARLSTPEGVKELEKELIDIITLKETAIQSEDFTKASEYRSTEKNLKQEIASATKKYRDDKNPVEVTDFDIATLLTSSTGIPVNILTNDLKRFMQMEEELNQEVIGQPEAVASIARSIRRQQAGLKDPKRPAGSFLFAGPTGVGKTELVKALTRFLFHDEDALISLDMSEYSEKHTVSRLFGAPPGFVGFEEGGQLTEKVRRKPYSVILFDEVEKAHPDIFNSLLQVLEEGRLTDGQGRVVDFKNTIIILTTNLGARQIATGSVGFVAVSEEASYNTMKSKVMTELKQNFKPEFLNRLDDMIVFPQLNSESLKQIVDLFINRLNTRLVEAGMKVELTESAKLHLISVGYDQTLGARPLRRAIQSLIEDSISEMILFDAVGENKNIIIDYVNNELLFNGMTRTQLSSSKEVLDA